MDHSFFFFRDIPGVPSHNKGEGIASTSDLNVSWIDWKVFVAFCVLIILGLILWDGPPSLAVVM